MFSFVFPLGQTYYPKTILFLLFQLNESSQIHRPLKQWLDIRIERLPIWILRGCIRTGKPLLTSSMFDRDSKALTYLEMIFLALYTTIYQYISLPADLLAAESVRKGRRE